ncbi:MAG: hypothetical protein RLZZ244_1802 [Verrucomicrobiota bacterium]
MQRRSNQPAGSRLGWIALIAMLVFFCVGLARSLHDRFALGDHYPAYSSARADPLGTQVLFESLERQEGLEVSRNFFVDFSKLRGEPGRTLILAGLNTLRFGNAESLFGNSGSLDTPALLRFAQDGGRLVIALDPVQWRESGSSHSGRGRAPEKSNPSGSGASQPREGKSRPSEEKPPRRRKFTSLSEALDLPVSGGTFLLGPPSEDVLVPEEAFASVLGKAPRWFGYVNLGGAEGVEVERNESGPGVTEGRPGLGRPWKVIARHQRRVAIAERWIGKGSVVVCSDRYFLSNEALWKEPAPALLSWLIGPAKHVIFEETHLDKWGWLGDVDGVMSLVRAYRMEGLIFGGILLFVLMLWRNASSLVPAGGSEDGDGDGGEVSAVEGRGMNSGLELLLRRGIPFPRLLQRCLEVWESSAALSRRVPETRRQAARKLVQEPCRAEDGVKAYGRVRDILRGRDGKL